MKFLPFIKKLRKNPAWPLSYGTIICQNILFQQFQLELALKENKLIFKTIRKDVIYVMIRLIRKHQN